MTKKVNGFTLIELMIVVVIVGILIGVAIPSYRETVMKSRREDAKGALMGLANAMERHFTVNDSYCDAAVAGGVNTCGVAGTKDEGSPTIYSTVSPVDGGTVYYNLTISDAKLTEFVLTATPTGGQAGDKCGNLTLAHTGARGHSTGSATECDW